MKNLLIILLAFLSIQSLDAQNNEFLPLSRYGLGTLSRTYSPFSQASGHAGLAYTSYDEFNSANPASLGFLRFTDAEIGYNLKTKKINFEQTNVNDLSGTLSYLQIAIPLQNSINEALEHKVKKHKYGISVGLSPFSNTSYSYLINDSTSIGKSIRRLNGTGGLNQFQFGFGYKIKNFGWGINLGYLFGNLKYDQVYYLTDKLPSSQDKYIDRYYGSGLNTQVACIYQQLLNKKEILKDKSVKDKTINYSLLIGLPGNINMSRYSLHTSVLSLGSVGTIIDTLNYQQEINSKASIPFKFVAGISYNKKEKSGLVADVGLENWGSSKKFEGEKGELVNNQFASIGAWIKPDNSGYANVLKRSQYRIGAFYEAGYLKLNNETLRQMGLTIGMATAFNFQRQLCVVNIGLELGKSELKNTLSENYFKVNLGFRINDSEWFVRRKYN